MCGHPYAQGKHGRGCGLTGRTDTSSRVQYSGRVDSVSVSSRDGGLGWVGHGHETSKLSRSKKYKKINRLNITRGGDPRCDQKELPIIVGDTSISFFLKEPTIRLSSTLCLGDEPWQAGGKHLLGEVRGV